MVPLFVLSTVFALLVLLRRAFPKRARYAYSDAAAWSLAVMLLLTASAHFNAMRPDLVRMVPTWLPAPELLVSLTGVLELLGAAGLFFARTRVWSGVLIALMFVSLLPANIYAAQQGLTIAGQPVTALWLRIPMQLLFIAFALAPALSRYRTLRAGLPFAKRAQSGASNNTMPS